MKKLLPILLMVLLLLGGCGDEPQDKWQSVTVPAIHQSFAAPDAEYVLRDAWEYGEDALLLQYRLEPQEAEWENWLALYSTRHDAVLATHLLGSGEVMRVVDETVIIEEERQVYSVQLEKGRVSFSDRVPLPDFLYEEVELNGDIYGVTNTDVSADLTQLLYVSALQGLNIYDLQTGENRLLFAPGATPFHHDTDFDWLTTPAYLSFLPGDEQIVFYDMFTFDNPDCGIWLCDLAGAREWFIPMDVVGDLWNGGWQAHDDAPIPCIRTDYREGSRGSFIAMADLKTQTLGEWRYLSERPEIWPAAYNEKCFAYIVEHPDDDAIWAQEVFVVDIETLEQTSVLYAEYGDITVQAITEDGRVLFSWEGGYDAWQLGAAVTRACGITDAIF